MLIIDRYIIREISKPLAVICTVLVFIFASYISTRYLADAVNGLLPGKTVVYLILLKVLIAMEVMLPITFYFSVVIALGRLYKDSEMTALFACGINTSRIFYPVFIFSLIIASIVASLSLFARPWAYEQFYLLRAQAKADFDISRMKEGHFYEINRGNRIIFAEEIDHRLNRADRVFIQSRHGDTLQVISAKKAIQHTKAISGERFLVFSDGYRYKFSRFGKEGRIVRFEQFALPLEPKEIKPLDYKVKTASSRHLAKSGGPANIAELQWRISTPLSTMLLALLAVPLSRSSPRQGQYAKVVPAVLIFAVYYNLEALAKHWVEQGAIGYFPGIWWVQALLAGLLLTLARKPAILFQRKHRYRKYIAIVFPAALLWGIFKLNPTQWV